MATITPTVTMLDENTVKFAYSAMTTANNDGSPIPNNWAGFTDRSAQVEGTLGAGGNLRIEGSNDGGSNYRALNDPFGAALNITAAGVKGVTEVPERTRPNVTAGDGTTSLNVTIVCHRPPVR